MKPWIVLISLLSVGARSESLKAGCDFQGALFSTEIEGGLSNPTANRLGMKIAPGLEFSFAERFTVRTLVGYEYRRYASLYSSGDAIGLEDFATDLLTLDAVGQFLLFKQTWIAVGAGYGIPLRTSGLWPWTTDVPDPGSQLMILAGFKCQMTPGLSILLGYQRDSEITRFRRTEMHTQAFLLGLRYDLVLSKKMN